MFDTDNLAYAAGLFDGEGCIMYTGYDDGHGFRLRLQLTMATPMGPNHFAETFGGRVRMAKRNQTHTQRKVGMYFSWIACGQLAEDTLRLMLPWLREKKSQAELSLQARAIQAKRPRGAGAYHRPEDRERLVALAKNIRAAKREYLQ